jgi:hypothetical protein
VISVLLPSRGRPDSLLMAIGSLLAQADDRDGIEVLVALDADDEATFGLIANGYWPSPAKFWIAPERYGYGRLHEYFNALAQQATGKWLMSFNDDARMLTQGWDTVVEAQGPAVLWATANHVPHCCVFPVWPRAWSVATGRVAGCWSVDSWIQDIGERLGLLVRVPVTIRHERFDVTGDHNDQTFAEGCRDRAAAVSPYWSLDHERATDAEVIRRLIAQEAV